MTLGKLAMTTGLSLVLAAMLGPRAFGVIAMALVFTNFIEMIQQQGMMPAIIARKTLRDEHKDTAFWLVIGAGVACTSVGLLVAPLWAGLNDLPELTLVIQVLALSVPLSSSVVVHEAILRRRLEFKKLTIRTWSSVLAGGAAGIGGAVLGWGVWALVAQQLVMNATTVVVLWGVSSWRPRLRFSGQAARELWSYAARSSTSSLGLFLGGRVDIILAGALFGPIVVGLYRMGQRLTQMVVDVTARSMQAVALPSLSALQDDRDAFAERLLRMQRIVAALTFPTLGVVAGIAPVVERLLGPEWQGTTVAIQVLAISQGLYSLALVLSPAMQARGRPGTVAVLVWIWAGAAAAALVGAATVPVDGTDGQLLVLCLAITAASAVGATMTMIAASRVFEVRIVTILGSSGPAVAAGVAAGAATWAIQSAITSPLVGAVVAGMLGVTVAATILALLDPVVRGAVRPFLDSDLRRRAAPPPAANPASDRLAGLPVDRAFTSRE
ncbi:oligosaccharide flippase family protein [Haloactinopolyspora alba]|nr:oligosaccharide flippase family protein [Haloactinopolyspora alba]